MNNEYCHMSVNGEDLDAYLTRKDIHRLICCGCTPEYEHSDKNVFQSCDKHKGSYTPHFSGSPKLNPNQRSDGKTDIKQKYERCLNKAQRRAKKIARRK